MTNNEIINKIDDKHYYKNETIIKEDKRISFAIMSSWAVLIIQYFILFYFKILNTSSGDQIQLISKAIVGTLFLAVFPTILKRNRMFFLVTYIIAVCILIYNYFIFPQNTEMIKEIIFPLFFTCLPSLIFSYSINNRKVLMDMTFMISDIVFVFGTLIGLLIFAKNIIIETYSMSLSYYMLLPAIINIYKLLFKKSMSSIIKCIISMGVILSIGSRGAVLCFCIYIILFVTINVNKITITRIIIYILSFSAIITIIIFFNNILVFTYKLLLNLGIKSRSILLFIQDPMHSSGRDWRYEEMISSIQKNPIFGIGITGDRIILGGYSHNIIIEILSGFGIIMGLIITFIIVYICFKTIFNKNKYDSNIAIVWFSIGFASLMVSGSYLTEFKLWIFLGITIRIIIEKRKLAEKRKLQETEIV